LRARKERTSQVESMRREEGRILTPSAHTLPLHSGLPRCLSSLLTQLRTGRSHLRADLYRTRSWPTDRCDCGTCETHQHFFLACPLFSSQCAAVYRAFGADALDLCALLTDSSRIHHTLHFIMDTGRFPRYHSEVPTRGGGGGGKGKWRKGAKS
jgi:hypothetical protein